MVQLILYLLKILMSLVLCLAFVTIFIFRIEIPAFGRPVHLGMLYDNSTSKYIVGKTLWSQEELESNVNTVHCRYTKTEIVCGRRFSEQFIGAKVDGRLKLNVLCKNVDVQGSAAYLDDDKGSKLQAQVVLKHETRTELRHLTMEHLEDSKISHPNVLEESDATHAVVGIQYGGMVLMKFAQEVTKEESSEKLEPKLKALVEKLKWLVALGVNADVNGTTHGATQTETIKVQVFSDFPAEKYPSTYEEAISFCENLPSLTGIDKIGIPVIVYLRPLKSLGCTLRENRYEARKGISDVLIDKACANIEYLQSVLAECQDLIEEDNFPTLKEQLKLFVQKVQEYTAFFQSKISQLIGDTLAGNDAFDAFLDEQEASVFSHAKLTKWLDEMKEKMKTLQGIMESFKGRESLKDIPIVSRGKLNSLLCNPKIPHVVCLAFEISDRDAQLSNMQAFLQKGPVPKSEETDTSLDPSLIHKALGRFMELAEDNKDNRSTTFVAMEEPLSSLGSG